MGNKNGKIELKEEIIDDICKTSGLENSHVREKCLNFLAKNPSGNMDKKQFKEFLKLVPGVPQVKII